MNIIILKLESTFRSLTVCTSFFIYIRNDYYDQCFIQKVSVQIEKLIILLIYYFIEISPNIK